MGFAKELVETLTVLRRIGSARRLNANLAVQQHILHPDVRGLIDDAQLEEQSRRRRIAVDFGALDREGEINHGGTLPRCRAAHTTRRRIRRSPSKSLHPRTNRATLCG